MTILNDNICPLTPNDVAGSPTPDPLVSFLQYQAVTQDTTSYENLVEESIQEAIQMICEKCMRSMVYGQYTESQRLYANGMVYPSATPIDITKVISSNVEGEQNIYDPSDPGTDPLASIVQGQGVWVGWFSPLPYMPFYTGVVPAQTIITYWGGWTQDTLPSEMKRLICKIVFKMLHPVSFVGMGGGVKSASVGGVSVSGSLSAFDIIDPGIKRDLRRWRHPQAEGWQV